MRIGILTQNYKPERGAAPTRLDEMAKGLKARGAEVCVVTAMPNYPTGTIFPEYKGKFSCTETINGVEVKRYWLFASNSRRTIPRILSMVSFSVISLFSWKYLRKKKLDYLIVQSPSLMLGYMAKYVARLAKSKLIVNVSDLWPLTAKEMGAIQEGRFYSMLEYIERKMYKSADLILGQSEEIVQYINDLGFKKTLLFRNGVSTKRFDGLTKKPKHSNLQIIYAGLLGYAQGIYSLCQNINFIELGAEFHIYGQGGEQEEIETWIKQHPDRGIIYHGSVLPDKVPELLFNSDLTIVPLVTPIFGAVPSKIYEAMAARLPILFLGKGEGARIIKDNNIGLVAESYADLINNIKYLQSNPEKLLNMAQNCYECAHNRFNREFQINALYQTLNS